MKIFEMGTYETQTAKRKIDKTIGRANSSLDPDGERREQKCQYGEEGIGVAHDCDFSRTSLMESYVDWDWTLLSVKVLLLRLLLLLLV